MFPLPTQYTDYLENRARKLAYLQLLDAFKSGFTGELSV